MTATREMARRVSGRAISCEPKIAYFAAFAAALPSCTWLTVHVAAASAAVLVGIFVLSITMSNARPATASRVSFTTETVEGVATFENKTWGTEIHLRARGFIPGQQYNVWLERADGSRVGAGTFTGVTHPPVIVTLSSALSESHAVAIGISQPDGTMVMRRSLT